MSEENKNEKKRGYGPDDNFIGSTCSSIDMLLEEGTRARMKQRAERLKNAPILVIPSNIK
jgi:hypothetical protein